MFNCSMKGCTNTSYNSQEDFYTFPKNFNICMLWVQNCGRDELFQEFIYGGAEPFINKWICSGHFRETDFINNTKVLGLKPKVLPIKSCQPITSVVIKQELLELPNEDPLLGVHKNVDVAIAPELHTLTTHNFLRPHHLYYAEETPRFIPPILIPETIVKDCIEPEQVVDIKPPIQQDEKRTMKRKENALRKAYKRLNETDEQRRRRLDQNAKRTALRRACETAEQRQERLEQNAKRTAFRRASENPEQRKERLRKNAERAAQRRAQEMYNETLERRMKNAMRAAERRRNESEQQRLERRMKDKLRARKWRSQETEDQLRERRYKNALTAAMRRNNESEEQAQHRKSMNAQRAAYRRSVDYVNNSGCSKLPHHGLGLDTNSCSSSVAETVARVSAGGEQVATINLSGLGATAGGAVLASVLCGGSGGMMEQDCRNLYSGELSARLLGPSQLPFS